MIDTSLITINSYEFNFRPFAYKLNLEGRLEIESKYKLGAKLLSGKLSLPNQIVDFIDITPNYRDRCKSKSRNCQVFTFNIFIQLSGDKYFSREFNERENVPFQFSLDFDTTNLESFKSYNYSFNPTFQPYSQPKRLSDYIANIKKLKINSHFQYQNSFYVERKSPSQDTHSLNIPISWSVRDNRQFNTYKYIKVKLDNYDNIGDYYIKELFSLQTDGRVQMDSSYISFSDGSVLNIPIDDISNRSSHYNWKKFQLNGTVSQVNKEWKYEHDQRGSGIFFPSKVSGTLNSKVYLFLNNHGYHIHIKNPFSFSGRYLNDSSPFIRVWIQNRNDNYFRDLRKFKFLSL